MRKKILICEDEEGSREALGLILKDKYEIAFVDCAPAAYEAVLKFNPDLVIMDIKLPRIDGIKALKEIRNLRKDINVMMITGYSSLETAKEATKHGASDYIIKPIDSKQVVEAIERILKK